MKLENPGLWHLKALDEINMHTHGHMRKHAKFGTFAHLRATLFLKQPSQNILI